MNRFDDYLYGLILMIKQNTLILNHNAERIININVIYGLSYHPLKDSRFELVLALSIQLHQGQPSQAAIALNQAGIFVLWQMAPLRFIAIYS